jgi:RNA recognition motif-containing protein
METIFVGNLSYFCTNKTLVELFSTVGPVHEVMVRKSRRNQPLHYGFVEMSPEDASKALEVMHNKDFMG